MPAVVDDHPFTRRILYRFKFAEVVKCDTARTQQRTHASFVICVHNQNHLDSLTGRTTLQTPDTGPCARAHTMTLEERKDGTVPYRTVHHRNT